MNQYIIDAYLQEKNALERAARDDPKNISKHIDLARFYVNWDDGFRAEPAIANLLKLAPADPTARFLEVRLAIQKAGQDTTKLERALSELATLRDVLPVAAILHETVKGRIALLSQAGPDGRIPEDAKVEASILKGLDLSGQDMTGWSLGFVELEDLKAPRSDWTASYLSEDDLSGADLTGAIFTEAVLSRADFKGAKLQGAKFAGAFIEGADLSGAEMQGANLRNVVAGGAKFVQTDLRGAVIAATFYTEADFTDADLRGADLRKARLADSTLTGARYDCQTRFPGGFRPEQHGMVFAGTDACVSAGQAGK